MNDGLEKTTFHEPGTVSTWFKNLFRTPPPSPAVVPTLAERRALLAERDRERERWEAEQRSHARRIEAARERVTEARALAEQAEGQLREAETQRLGAALNHSVRLDRLEARIRAGASPHLETFARDVRDQLEALRAAGVDVHEAWGRPNPFDGQRPHHVSSNAASVEARRRALGAALAAAEAMQLEPLEEVAVIERLTALRDAVPTVEPLTVPGADPLTAYERRTLDAEASR